MAKKVLFILGSFFPAQVGGPNNTIYWLAKELAKKKCVIKVICLDKGITKEHRAKYNISESGSAVLDGIEVDYCRFFGSQYFSPKFLISIWKEVGKSDVVHLTSVFYPWTWAAGIACLVSKVPFTVAPRGELEPVALGYSKFKKKVCSELFLRWLFGQAKKIIVTSDAEQRNTSLFFGGHDKILVIPNYIDLSSIPRFDAKDRPNVIGYIGRLHPKKNLERLIEIYAELVLGNGFCGDLLIAGSGDKSYQRKLKTLVSRFNLSSRIKFLGHVEGVEKTVFFSSISILVLPSLSENFGNVVVEALANGVPVIASRGTPWSILVEAKCGSWVDVEKELGREIMRVFALDDFEFEKMRVAARQTAVARFDSSTNREILTKAYLMDFK